MEQRRFVTDAAKLLAAEHPALAESISSSLDQLARVSAPSVAHLAPVANPAAATFLCGGHTVGFGPSGAITTLRTSDRTEWASAADQVGLYQCVASRGMRSDLRE